MIINIHQLVRFKTTPFTTEEREAQHLARGAAPGAAAGAVPHP